MSTTSLTATILLFENGPSANQLFSQWKYFIHSTDNKERLEMH